MKKLFYLVTLIALATTTAFAQVPQGFNYQAVIKDNNGDPLSEGAVDIEVKINKDFSTVYCESHENAAVEQGLLNLIIGTGALCGPETELSEVDWSTGEFTMEVTVTDMDGATVSGESPLVSVPFAMHAGTVENSVWNQDGNKVTVVQSNSLVGIGTDSPLRNVHIKDTSTVDVLLESDNSVGLQLRIDANQDAFISNLNDFTGNGTENNRDLVLSGEQDIYFRTGGNPDLPAGSSRMVVKNNGKVGIGTNNPDKNLQIFGEGDPGEYEEGEALIHSNWQAEFGKADAGRVLAGSYADQPALQGHGTGTSYNLLLNPYKGNVGIGTTSPSQKLHIENGNLFVRRTAPWIHLQESDNGDKNWYMVVDGKYFSVRENNTSTQRFTIAEGGNIGIGAPVPSKAKLQIEGVATHNPGSSFWTYFNNGSNDTPLTYISSGGNRPLSLYASNDIAANSFHAFSDARIKNVKGVSNSEQDLETLQQIEVTDYTYKDYIAKGRTPQKKVIAQQVAEVYPQAVTADNTEIIPDIMQSAEVSNGWVQLSDHGLSEGDKVRLIFEERTAELEVTEVTSEGFQVATEEEGKVFVYGREVDDFHTVDYEAISMLNVSATQELAKVIERQQAEIEHLKSANADVMARLEALEAALGKNRSASAIQQ